MNKLMTQYRDDLTKKLVEAMAEGDPLPWQKPWSSAQVRPFNPATKTRYRGGNVITLLEAAAEKGSADPRWLTFNQIQKAGLKVRKGATGVPIEYWLDLQRVPENNTKTRSTADDDALDSSANTEEDDDAKPRVVGRVYRVFNGEDVIGLAPLQVPEPTWTPSVRVQRLLQATGASVDHQAVLSLHSGMHLDLVAGYSVARDKIIMPPHETFKSLDDYAATLLHELAHWTGHPDRLARLERGDATAFGNEAYAKEELRAEISAYFLKNLLGIEGEVANHARYVGHWLTLLAKDRHEIYRAAKDASLITDYLIDADPELKAELDAVITLNGLTAKNLRDVEPVVENEVPAFDITGIVVPPPGVGREDARWPAFEALLREQASRFAIEAATLDDALETLSTSFTTLMNAARAKGYTDEEVNDLISAQLVTDLRGNSVREQRWAALVETVHRIGDPTYGAAMISTALTHLGKHYRAAIQDALAHHATGDEIDTRVRALIYGEKGRRPIDLAFVEALVNPRSLVEEDDADDVIGLTGGGAHVFDDDVMTHDSDDDDVTLSPLVGPNEGHAVVLDFIEDEHVGAVNQPA